MPIAHNVVRIGGTLPGGEVWSVNPKFGVKTGGLVIDYSDLLLWAGAISTLNSSNVLPADIRTIISSACAVTVIRCEYRGNSGDLEQAAEVVLSAPAPGTGLMTKPFQSALVSSLLTGRPGRSYRGRLYWPALGASINGSTGRVAPAQVLSFTAAVSAFLSAVQMAAPVDGGVALSVVSDTISTATPVTSILSGDILDTQRRRRDALEELRTSQPFPPI